MARDRRIKITIVTSPVKSNDGVVPAGGYLYYRRRLAENGKLLEGLDDFEALPALKILQIRCASALAPILRSQL